MNFKTKKAQGLPLNVIVLGVISLIILVVLIFILLNQSGILISGLESCTAKGGKCVASETECDATIMQYECSDDRLCCLGRCTSKSGECKVNCDDNNEDKVYFTECDDKGMMCCKQKPESKIN